MNNKTNPGKWSWLFAACVIAALALAGCKSAEEHPHKTEHPTSEHPSHEHPK